MRTLLLVSILLVGALAVDRLQARDFGNPQLAGSWGWAQNWDQAQPDRFWNKRGRFGSRFGDSNARITYQWHPSAWRRSKA